MGILSSKMGSWNLSLSLLIIMVLLLLQKLLQEEGTK
jgi:hypothetical protein